MKNETMLKILKRYQRSLEIMKNEAINDGEPDEIVKHYELDSLAMRQAIETIETIAKERK